MKKFKQGLIFLAIPFFMLSCNGPSDPQPLTIVGKWNIQRIDSSISEISAAVSSSSKDVSSKGLFIQFYSNLSFATNTDLSLTKLQLVSGTTKTGSYNLYENNNQDVLILSFYDNELKDDVALSFEVLNMDSNNPVLYMDTQDYIESLRESANGMELTIRQALINYSNRINSASFSLNCKK